MITLRIETRVVFFWKKFKFFNSSIHLDKFKIVYPSWAKCKEFDELCEATNISHEIETGSHFEFSFKL